MLERYRKQALVGEIGEAGQRRIGRGRMLVVGAGGLGCAVLPYLAGAGVGRITIVDDDRVERSNLQRQVLFGESSIGRPKARAAAERLADLNPDIDVRAVPARLDPDNVGPLLGRHDIVIDGTDNYATKYLLADACVRFGRPLVYGSVTGMDALVSIFDAGNGPCLRCLFPEAPRGWVPNCAEAGVLGPLVGITGTMQAAEAIKLLAGAECPDLAPIVGRLWTMDARTGQSRLLSISRRADCSVCSQPPGRIDLGVHAAASALPEIDAADIERYPGWPLLDVREPAEFAHGHAPGSVNVPLSSLQRGCAPIPASDRGYLIYCSTGKRCREAASLLRTGSDADIRIVRGGYDALCTVPSAGSAAPRRQPV
jgi:adenylyltransferase/sulfurtransferase